MLVVSPRWSISPRRGDSTEDGQKECKSGGWQDAWQKMFSGHDIILALTNSLRDVVICTSLDPPLHFIVNGEAQEAPLLPEEPWAISHY